MELTFTVQNDGIVVNLVGELDTPATVEIQPQVDKLLPLTDRKVVINCSQLNYIASSGLRQLITIYKKCNTNGGKLELHHLNPDVMEIFRVTNFNKVFTIVD